MIPTHPLFSHGDTRNTFEGDRNLPRTITFALTLLVVFAIGVLLIVQGLS